MSSQNDEFIEVVANDIDSIDISDNDINYDDNKVTTGANHVDNKDDDKIGDFECLLVVSLNVTMYVCIMVSREINK